jgi:hypothetical protein
MGRKGRLPEASFASLAAGFEGKLVSGMQGENSFYVPRKQLRTLVAEGWLGGDTSMKDVRRKSCRGVVSHFVSLRHPSGGLSERTYSLVAVFKGLVLAATVAVPSLVFVDSAGEDDNDGGDGNGEDEPKMKSCPYYICMRMGELKQCTLSGIDVLESEACPADNAGCPGTECAENSDSGGGDGGIFDTTVILGI